MTDEEKIVLRKDRFTLCIRILLPCPSSLTFFGFSINISDFLLLCKSIDWFIYDGNTGT